MERKITCPNCFNSTQCFEEEIKNKNFSSYMCFNCGFNSNSLYKNDSQELEKAVNASTQLMNEVSMYDYERNIHWFPSVLNMGQLGIIYPEGTRDNWMWKFASVRELSEEEKKDPKYKGHQSMLDVETAIEYGQYEFLNACTDMGIIKGVDKDGGITK